MADLLGELWIPQVDYLWRSQDGVSFSSIHTAPWLGGYTAVTAPDSQHVWSCNYGNFDNLLWNGSAFTRYYIWTGPLCMASLPYRRDLAWVAGYGSGDAGRLWEWNGSVWSNKSIPSNLGEVWDMWAYDEENLYLVGSKKLYLTSAPLLTHYNPRTDVWTTLSDLQGTTGGSWNGIHGFSPTQIYLSGNGFVDLNYRLSKWNGSSLIGLSPPSRNYSSINGSSPTNLWATTSDAGEGRWYRSTNGGSSWSQKYFKAWPDGNLTHQVFLPDGQGWAVGSDQKIIHWTGSSVVERKFVPGGADFNDITFADYPYYMTVTPNPVSEEGGTEMTGVGRFPVGEELRIYMGQNGDTSDPLCYCGQGYGYSREANSQTLLTFVSPPTEKGEGWATVEHAAGTFRAPVTILEKEWRSKGFATRGEHPPWAAVGARRLGLEGRR